MGVKLVIAMTLTLSEVGAAIAVSGGILGFLIAEISTLGGDPAAMRLTAIASLVVAAGGLISTLGSQLTGFMKVYWEQKQEDRRAKQERHDLANKLQSAYTEIDSLKEALEQTHAGIEQHRQGLADLAASSITSPTLVIIKDKPSQ